MCATHPFRQSTLVSPSFVQFSQGRTKKNGMLSPLATTPVASIVPRGKRLGPTPTCPPTRSSIAVAFYRTHASAIRATMGRPPLRLLECIFRMRGRRGDRGRRWHVGARARGSGFRSGGPSRRVARACPPGPLATHGYDRVFDCRHGSLPKRSAARMRRSASSMRCRRR